jgi:molecular chaperone DnaK (HSP70)
MADIGIDLGTTNSVVAYLRGAPVVIQIKGHPLVPSALAYQDGEWIVGHAAKSLAGGSAYVITSPKRFMGTDKTWQVEGKTYTPVNLSALILKEIKKHAEAQLGEPITSAIITHPAHFNLKQIEDTRAAGIEAGLKVSRLLAEPIAAGATYGSGGEDVVLVFDLGGGTLDCTVINTFDAKIMGLSGDNYLGGDDFDFRIVDRMTKHLQKDSGIDISGDEKARLQLKAKAEMAKKNLSDVKSTQVEFVGKLQGNHAGKLVSVDFTLTRAEYNEMIKDLVDRSIEKADEAVARAGLTKDDLDVILLVGGSTLTPYVQERLQRHYGKEPAKTVDPMLAVGLGAAICTRGIGWDGTHRVMLRSRADVWSGPAYPVKGRTTAQSKIIILGGARAAEGVADSEGKFSLEVNLNPSASNDLTIEATSPKGEMAKAHHCLRHDPQAGKTVELPPDSILHPVLPHNIMLGLEGDDVAILIEHGQELPYTGISNTFSTRGGIAQRHPLIGPVLQGHMPEHEIPHASFNMKLGELRVECPPTTKYEGSIPLVVEFEVNESSQVRIKCWFRDDPSVSGEVKLSLKNIPREDQHLVQRTETALAEAGEKLSPDEKTRIKRKMQALVDLCEQFKSSPSPETRKQIDETGKELRTMVKTVEQRFNLK